MAWRGLHISRAAHLSLDHSRLKVRFLEDEEPEPLFFSLEDVAWIILDHARSTLSARMVAACMENGTPVVFSDQRHHPCGMALPFHQHFAQPEVARLQISVSRPFRKQVWTQIVKTKIINQAQTLGYLQMSESTVLAKMAQHVRSGDPKNVVARAARYYWSLLF
jgi:CRISPR-associated protein Cas1